MAQNWESVDYLAQTYMAKYMKELRKLDINGDNKINADDAKTNPKISNYNLDLAALETPLKGLYVEIFREYDKNSDGYLSEKERFWGQFNYLKDGLFCQTKQSETLGVYDGSSNDNFVADIRSRRQSCQR